jgi:hypothetical protein
MRSAACRGRLASADADVETADVQVDSEGVEAAGGGVADLVDELVLVVQGQTDGDGCWLPVAWTRFS